MSWGVKTTNNDLPYLLIKDGDETALTADFLMRPDAQWFADYLNGLEKKAELATRYRERIQRDVDHARMHDYKPSISLFMEDFAADYDALTAMKGEQT